MSDRLGVLQGALALFDAGRYAEAAAMVDPAADGHDIAADAIGAAARGLVLEAEGDVGASMPLMERAFYADVALPGLLRAIALYFERNGRPAMAHHAMLALDMLDPDLLPARSEDLRGGGWARHATRYVRQRLSAGRTLTYPLAPVKAGLVERIGPAAATMVLAGIEDGETARIAARLPLQPLIDHARAVGIEYAEVVPAADVLSTRPTVLGGRRVETVTKHTRALFACILRDIVVGSRSNVLISPDAILLDVQHDELARDPMLSVDPLVVARAGSDVYVTAPRDRGELPAIAEAVWLTGIHSPAFGHWVMEFLPKVWALMERPGFGDVPVLIDEGMPSQHEEALRLFVGPAQPFVRLRASQQVRVDRLWVASQLVYLAAGPRPNVPRSPHGRALHPDGFRRLIERAKGAIRTMDLDGLPSRIHLTRPATGHRRLANADAIEALLRRHDFEVLDFGRIPFAEQLRHILAADQVIGQDGSALLLTILGRPGLRIGGLAQPQLEEWEWYADACLALGQELTVVVGDIVRAHPGYAWMSDYSIDARALEAYLRQPESR